MRPILRQINYHGKPNILTFMPLSPILRWNAYLSTHVKTDVGSSRINSGRADAVIIAPRIERTPTALLEALENTIGKDYTAPHYKYHDDPYLIPMSNLSKRSFALSKESGRKAAKWIRQEHADLFQHRVAEPPVQAFYPSLSISQDTEIDESILKTLIADCHVTDAVQAYETLKNKEIQISDKTKQDLVELLAFYNEMEPLDEEWIEERWYKAGVTGRERRKNTWKENGLVERIFKEMDSADATMHCTVIRGRAKYFQVEKAWQLFREAQGKNLPLDVETYNALIKTINFLKDNSDMRVVELEDLLVEMENAGIQPNTGTLNAVLEILTGIGNIRAAKSLSLNFLAEFKLAGVEPSLASYYHLLVSHCRDRGPISSILVDIMNELEGKTFAIKDPKDTFFFLTAMDVCRNHLHDSDLANRVNRLLHVGDNYNLIGDSYKESVYYRNFVSLKCSSESFDTFMDFYDKLVPHIYAPEPQIMEEILKSLKLNEGYDHLSRLWSDMIIFDLTFRENLVSLVLSIMSEYMNSAPTLKHMESFGEIGWKVWELVEGQDPERVKKINWTGQNLGNIMVVLLKIGKLDHAFTILKKLLQSPLEIVGIPEIDALKLFLEIAIKEGVGSMCLACLQYISDCGFPEIRELGYYVYQNVKLDSLQLARVNNIVGCDITTLKTDKIETK